ncbi:MAG: metalloregulator ArsR/SmtB family transcription factor [bacterium]
MNTNINEMATIFKALGDPTRLHIFKFLLALGKPVAVEGSGDVRTVDGLTVGEVCCHVTGVEKITSTISAHLKELRLAGLITMEKRGKYVICSANPEAASLLSTFLAGPETDSKCCELSQKGLIL